MTLKRIHYLGLLNLKEALITERKAQLLKRAKKSGIIYLKKKVWKKYEGALVSDKLYIWDLQRQYPIAKVIVRTIRTKQENELKMMLVGDRRK